MAAFVKTLAFAVAAVALAGCCTSSNGCYVAAPGIPTAWDGDGQGTRPSDGTEAQPSSRPSAKRVARAKTEMIIGPIGNASGQAVEPYYGAASETATDRQAPTGAQAYRSPSARARSNQARSDDPKFDNSQFDKAQFDKRWAQDQEADRAADAKLAKQLMICSNCLPPAGN
jgi:hypothetical protein